MVLEHALLSVRPGQEAAYEEWRELLHGFYDPFPTVEHFVPVDLAEPARPAGAPPRLGPLHHVQLAVPAGSEDACRRFWGGVLGLRELAKPAALAARGGCWFGGGALEVHCGVEEPFAPARKAHPGVLVDGLADLAERLERAGHPVTWDADFPGHDRCYASDPFGNRLELLQPRARG